MEATYSHFAFGLTIHSSLELPELVATASLQSFLPNREHCVDIVEKPFTNNEFDNISSTQRFAVKGCKFYFIACGIGRFCISDGCHIQFERDPNCAQGTVLDSDIRVFLLSTCLGTVLMQRGYFLLHASVAAKDNNAVAVAGDSGAGKSTSLGVLFAQGWQLVSDDLCAITWNNGKPMVIPAYPQIKLNPDSVSHLGLAEKELVWINRFKSKKAYRVPNDFNLSPIPLSSIALLERCDKISQWNERLLSGANKYIALHRNAFRRKYHRALGIENDVLRHVANLANVSELKLFQRPAGVSTFGYNHIRWINDQQNSRQDKLYG